MVNKIEILDDGQFTELVNNSESIADVLRKLNYSVKGNSWGYLIIRDRMQKLQITFKKSKDLQVINSTFIKTPIEDLLVEDSSYSSSKLRNRLINEGIKKAQCEICGITEWLGKPINFELHHINGVHTDHRLENLQILCPNCHSQTENFGSRNKSSKNVQSIQNIPESVKEEIMNKVSEVGIVEARKQLSYRNSFINKVVKENHDIIVLITPNGEELEFPTIKGAALYIHETCGLGASVDGVRSNLSNVLGGRQKTCQGFTCFRKHNNE